MPLTAIWLDREREPQCPTQPDFPNGTDVDMSDGAAKTCSMEVPYPAKRCGIYIIECSECKLKVGITTAGRLDDPRIVTLGCFSQVLNPNPPGTIRIVPPGTTAMKRTPHQ